MIAFNSLSSTRDNLVWFDAPEGITALRDETGVEYPVQFAEGRACALS